MNQTYEISSEELDAIIALVSHYYGHTFTYEDLQAHVNLLDDLCLREGVHPDQGFYESGKGGEEMRLEVERLKSDRSVGGR